MNIRLITSELYAENVIKNYEIASKADFCLNHTKRMPKYQAFQGLKTKPYTAGE